MFPHPVVRLFFTTATATLALFAGAAIAGEPAPQRNPEQAAASTNIQAEFGTLDTNANHLIDRSEAKASEALESNFEQLDQNHDGQLSESEFSGFERAHPSPSVSREKTEAVQENAKDTEPQESWFTAPEHQPSQDDEPSRAREPR